MTLLDKVLYLQESKYRETPDNLRERLFYDAVKAGGVGGPILDKYGNKITHGGGEPGSRKLRRKGHIKGSAVYKSPGKPNIDIHYYEHPETGERIDLKFKDYFPEEGYKPKTTEAVMLSRPFLIEAVKGGLDAGNHELHGTVTWRDENGQHQHGMLTHGFDGVKQRSLHDGIKEYADVIKNPKLQPRIHISVIHKPSPGRSPSSRFFDLGDEDQYPLGAKSRISVKHSYPAKIGDDLHFSTDLISTPPQHRRKGWASTLFDSAHKVLKRHGIHSTHDPIQLEHGKRWAAGQETARGDKYEPIHRIAQKEPLTALGIHTKIKDDFPDYEDHHDSMIALANRILDRSGGYHAKKEHTLFRRVLRKTGAPPIGIRKVASFMRTLGGDDADIPRKVKTGSGGPMRLPPWRSGQ